MRYRLELKLITVMMSIVLMVSNNLNCFAAGKTNEVKTCVAYYISFKGTYNGIPIEGDVVQKINVSREGEKYCAVVDSSGIISSAVCHRDYEIVERKDISNVSKNIKLDVLESQLEENGFNIDTIVENPTIVFTDDDKDGIYDPSIKLKLANEDIVNFNCISNKVSID